MANPRRKILDAQAGRTLETVVTSFLDDPGLKSDTWTHTFTGRYRNVQLEMEWETVTDYHALSQGRVLYVTQDGTFTIHAASGEDTTTTGTEIVDLPGIQDISQILVRTAAQYEPAHLGCFGQARFLRWEIKIGARRRAMDDGEN